MVSGGQTGVDRAALDAAMGAGLPVSGWCPRGRRAEDGPLSPVYPLTETPSRDYRQRTRWNVRDSDATLILSWGRLSGGTLLTVRILADYGRPHRVVPLDADPDPEAVRVWLREQRVVTLNVAGPRGDGAGEIYAAALAFLRRIFTGTEGGSG
ncbi:putative molybdenum carrier protein [Thiohalorhabdus methylotrophus]|uniref:Molybdenum carrier protein n=1 Tax=Thiohalorhabdus methylotrophus TaxID=3242694 RepID=A0ABV4TRR7_9GAMM